MADAFRPEILAAFMQQVVDEAVLPTLFLRTASVAMNFSSGIRSSKTQPTIFSGHHRRHHVQVFAAICVDYAPLPSHYQKSLDDPSTVGRFYPLRESHRAAQFRRAASVT
jgi:hypothetical protein